MFKQSDIEKDDKTYEHVYKIGHECQGLIDKCSDPENKNIKVDLIDIKGKVKIIFDKVELLKNDRYISKIQVKKCLTTLNKAQKR